MYNSVYDNVWSDTRNDLKIKLFAGAQNFYGGSSLTVLGVILGGIIYVSLLFKKT